MRQLRIVLAALLAAPSVAVAQSTFVVDAQNGPGTQFTTLTAAVAAVPDGAILLVRPGTYTGVVLDGKGMSILATAPGVHVTGLFTSPLTVRNLAPHQSVVIRGVTPTDTGIGARLWFERCRGAVLVDDVTFVSVPSVSTVLFPVAILADRCAAVTVRDCRLRAFTCVYAKDSAVVIEGSTLEGNAAFFISHAPSLAGTAIRVEGGSVTTSRCRATGGDGLELTRTFVAQPGPAVVVDGGLLRLAEDSTGSFAAGVLAGAAPTPAIGGTQGSVVRDPSPTLTPSNGGPAVAASLTDSVRPLPSLRTVAGPPGGRVDVDVTTPVGESVLLALSLPGAPVAVAGVDGELWLSSDALLVVAVGVPQPGQPLSLTVPVPADPILLAKRFTWQALAWSAVDGLRASNPSTYAH